MAEFVDTRLHYDHDADRLVVERVQDVEPILDYTARLRALNPAGYSPSRDLKHVAEVPLVLVEKWANDAGMSVADWLADPELMRRQLNDPANAFLRTGKGRL